MGPHPTHGDPWGPLRSSLASWRWLSRAAEIWWTRRGGAALIAATRAARLDALVAFARSRSPFYRHSLRALPERGFALADLPVVTKRELMSAFDDWVTDRAVTRAGVDAFVADPDRIGERFLDRYVLWKSSGTTGEPGIYVQDADALDVTDALVAVQLESAGFARQFAAGLVSRAGRAALIAATGEHFATVASWRRLGGGATFLGSRCLSVMEPLGKLVAELNAYAPAFVASYPTMLSLLADERVAGRLRIAPSYLWSGGEYLAPAQRTHIERAFGCPIANEYGASECMCIAYGCREDWLHLNADWVILEAVERDYRPTPPGTASHSTLLTNLANRVQPLVRYELGDSIVVKPEPCACGNPLPAIRVEGRRDDIVALVAEDGSIVRLLPLALSTVIEEGSGVHRFQIIQDAPARLRLKLDVADRGARRATAKAAADALRGFLRQQSLANVRVVVDRDPPVPESASGKLRQVVVRCDPAHAS